MSLAALMATPVAWWTTRPSVAAGTIPWPRAAPTTPPGGRPSPGVDPAERGDPSGAGLQFSRIRIRSGRLADQLEREAPTPVAVRIAAIGIDSAVVPVGVSSPGMPAVMQIPANVRVIGWYRFGAAPGGRGSAVLVGHVDSAAQGQGAFFRLRSLPLGASIVVIMADGSRRSFRVVARRMYPKGALPRGVFVRSGAPILTLITCGGTFDRAKRSYESNVVVFARPGQ